MTGCGPRTARYTVNVTEMTETEMLARAAARLAEAKARAAAVKRTAAELAGAEAMVAAAGLRFAA